MIARRLLHSYSKLTCALPIGKPASVLLPFMFLLSIIHIEAKNFSEPGAKITLEAGRDIFAPGELVKIRYQGKTREGYNEWIRIYTTDRRGHSIVRKPLPHNAKVNDVISFLPNEPNIYIVWWGKYKLNSNIPPIEGRSSVIFTVKAGFTSKKSGTTVKEAKNLLDDIATIEAMSPRINAVLTSYNKASASTPEPLTVDGLQAVMPRYQQIEADFRELAGHLEKTAANGQVVELAAGIRKVAAEFRSLADGMKTLQYNAKLGDLTHAEQTCNKMTASTQSLAGTIRTFIKKRDEAKILANQLEMKSWGKPRIPEWSQRYFESGASSTESNP